MTDDERQDLLEMKAFLMRAIEQLQEELLTFPADGSEDDYLFMIAKAVMYRETFKKVMKQLENDFDDE